MTQVNIVVSEHAFKPLIHINDLKTVETAVHKLLCMDSLPEPQQKELSNDILYHWVEDTGENGRHCVAPLVHVLVSERLTAIFASMMEEPFMCHVMPAESTPRSMDWILVLHFDAFKRIQDMAFTESRKLLTADASIEKFIHDRVVITKDSVRPNECYAITRDVVRAPLTSPKWKTAHVSYDGATINVWQANALQKYATKAAISGCGSGGVDEAVREANAASERIRKIGAGERLFIVYPADDDEKRMNVLRGTGRDVLEAMRIAKFSDLILFFSQAGELRYVCDPEGHLIDTSVGAGAEIADAAASAGKHVDGSGIIAVPGNRVHVTRIHPVGSELREEAAALKGAIAHYRGMVDGDDTNSTPVPGMWQGTPVTYEYAPFTQTVRDKLGTYLTEAAKDLGMVLMFYRDSGRSFQFILCTDREGNEISSTQGIGNDIAKAFGGVCGRPARK